MGGQVSAAPALIPIDNPLFVGMTRAKDRLVFARRVTRNGKRTGGTRFLDELWLTPVSG